LLIRAIPYKFPCLIFKQQGVESRTRSPETLSQPQPRQHPLSQPPSPVSTPSPLNGRLHPWTPSMKDRELQHNVSLLHDQVQRLIRTVESLRTTHIHSTVFDRVGGETATTPRSPKRNLAAYQPIPANGHHTLGNTRLTHKHVQASAKEAMMPIIWDSGTSISLSFNRADLVLTKDHQGSEGQEK
jgi:hypothetical protein